MSRKKSRRINVLNNSGGEDDKVKRNADGIEYEEVETRSEEWQCNICGSAQKRSRSRSRSHGEEQKHLATRKLQRETRARVEAALLPMLDLRRTTLPERMPKLGKRWTAASHHHGVDIVATRKFFRTDSSTMELLASKAIQGIRQGKEERQRKRRKG